MKKSLLVFILAGVAFAQTGKIVGQIDGKDWTDEEVKTFLTGFNPQVRNSYVHNPADTLGNLLMLEYLAKEAESHKLDQNSEQRGGLDWAELNLLAQAEVNRVHAAYVPSEDEKRKAYEKNPQRWDQAHVRVIFISFSPGDSAGHPVQTEAEAKAKIEDLRKQIDSGADFASLAQKNSDDKLSADKGGQWAVVTHSSTYPEAMLLAIFALKEGEVSPPVRQSNGFYLFKVESLRRQPLAEVEGRITAELKQAHLNEWLNGVKLRTAAKIVAASYFGEHDADDDDDDDDDAPKPGDSRPTHPPQRPEKPHVEPPPNTVVANINGKDWTAAKMQAFIATFPPQIHTAFTHKGVATLDNLLMLEALRKEALAHGLDKDPQLEQNLRWSKVNLLSQAELNYARTANPPSTEEEKQLYDSNPQRWEQAHMRAIEVAFSPGPAGARISVPGVPTRTEEAAKARAEELRRKLAGGADFAALAKTSSDDQATAVKGGAWAPMSRNSPYPQQLKLAVFALRPGEISEPQRQPNAFYLLKLDSITKQPFAEVEASIRSELQQAHFNQWFSSIKTRFTVEVKDSEFFAQNKR